MSSRWDGRFTCPHKSLGFCEGAYVILCLGCGARWVAHQYDYQRDENGKLVPPEFEHGQRDNPNAHGDRHDWSDFL